MTTMRLGLLLLTTLFALPVIRMTKGSPWQVAVIVGLLLALPMNIGHVLPNVFMPDPSVRLSHFVETATSNFIFGLMVTWLMVRRHHSVRDLFGQCPKVRLQTTQLHDVAS